MKTHHFDNKNPNFVKYVLCTNMSYVLRYLLDKYFCLLKFLDIYVYTYIM